MGEGSPEKQPKSASRRRFIGVSSAFAGLGVASSYGYLAWMAGAYLSPEAASTRDVYIAKVADVKVGDSFPWTTPSGGKVLITRVGDSGKVEDFRALSDICPHLGCKVHWQPTEEQFFCPCHNGTFDSNGKGTGGPPGDANQELATFPLVVNNGMLFVSLKEERGL